MNSTERALQEQTRALWATLSCFVLGTLAGALVLWGNTHPFTGGGSVIIPTALISGTIAAAAFVFSTLFHRRRETVPMPRWQAVVSNVTSIAVTIAFGGVTGLGVLLAGQVLASGLLIGVAAALGGRLSFQAGVDLSARDLSALLFAFLIVGTVFAMITQADPHWWERNFSQLGIGGGWAFNGTLVIAGLLVATIGSYIGRDLHRLLDDETIPRITVVVLVWGFAGLALAGVGLTPLDQLPVWHLVTAFAALVLLVGAAGYTQLVLPEPPFVLKTATAILVILVGLASALTFMFSFFSVTALESIVVGLAVLWMTTLIRVLSILTPNQSLASRRRHLLVRARQAP